MLFGELLKPLIALGLAGASLALFATSSTPSKLQVDGSSEAAMMSASELARVALRPLVNGLPQGEAVRAGSLWKEGGAIVFAVRRPGCVLCREEAQVLTSVLPRIHALGGEYEKVRLVGVFKEALYGGEDIRDFSEFFQGAELFLDEENLFYKAFGSNTIKLFTWNPFEMYRRFTRIGKRIKESNEANPGGPTLEGNLRGEGMIEGGLYVFGPGEPGRVVWSRVETTGEPPEADEVFEAVRRIHGDAAAAAPSD